MLGRSSALLLPLLLLLAAACGSTRIVYETKQTDPDGPVPIVVDGLRAGYDRVERPLPYFGAQRVAAGPPTIQPETSAPLEPLLRDARRTVRIPPPVTPWIFPFDFAAEVFGRAVGLVPLEHRIALERELYPSAAALDAPMEERGRPDLDALRARAAALATRR